VGESVEAWREHISEGEKECDIGKYTEGVSEEAEFIQVEEQEKDDVPRQPTSAETEKNEESLIGPFNFTRNYSKKQSPEVSDTFINPYKNSY